MCVCLVIYFKILVIKLFLLRSRVFFKVEINLFLNFFNKVLMKIIFLFFKIVFLIVRWYLLINFSILMFFENILKVFFIGNLVF